MFDVSDLDTVPGTEKGARTVAKKADTREKFPCQSCAGTGLYRGARVHQEKAHCFACKGNGFFYTSQGDRMKAKAAAAKRATNKLETAQAGMLETHPDLRDILALIAWSDMGKSFAEQFNTKGTLSDRQVDVARSMAAKCRARDAERAAKRVAEQAARTSAVDLSPIQAMFESAMESGLKKLAYRAEGLKLSPAKDTGKNPGAIYVKRLSDGQYLGKIVEKKFLAVRECTDGDKEHLQTIAINPAEAARLWGRNTGECSCCGRELTDPNSIAAGIGPICAEKWAL